jgi:hypothetical protein
LLLLLRAIVPLLAVVEPIRGDMREPQAFASG